LTVLAGDAFAMVLGVGLGALCAWPAVLTRSADPAGRRAGRAQGRLDLLAIGCRVAAMALLAEHGMGPPDLSFAGMRGAPPDGWRGAAILLLVLIGAGARAASAPLVAGAAPTAFAALVSGAAPKVALYVVIRLLVDLGGAAQPLWWGVPLLALGTGAAVLGARRAVAQGDVKAVIAAGTLAQGGFMAIGIGTAMVARGADLPSLAALALAGTLLHALNQGVVETLLTLCAGAVARGAGTQALSRLGGLIHRMPITTGCVLIGAAGAAAVPAFAGFAGTWLLFQSVLAAPRIGGIALQTGFAIVAAALALAVALAAVAAVRLVGIAFLGRPRTPRAAVAEDAGRFGRIAMLGLSALAMAFGLLPGPLLWLLEPALRALAGVGMDSRAGWLAIAPGQETPGYAALPIMLLLALFAGGALLAMRRTAATGTTRGAAWTDGFAAPPAWLPFGDPTTQYTGASFAHPVLALTAPMPAPDAAAWRRLAGPARARLLGAVARARARARLSRRDHAAAGRGDRHMLTAATIVLVLFLTAIAMLGTR
jgi:hydrogenase-4 component B